MKKGISTMQLPFPAGFIPVIFFSTFLSFSNGARILGIFPMAARSHFTCNDGIMRSLLVAGHEVTVISPFPSYTKMKNYTNIDSSSNTFVYVGQSSFEDFTSISDTEMIDIIISVEEKYCHDVMKLDIIQEILKSDEKKFDVIFLEVFTMFECFLPLAEKLGIPVIGTVTIRTWLLSDAVIGIPNNPSIMPNEMIGISRTMDLFKRIKNVWYKLYVHYVYYTKIQPLVQKIHEQYFNPYLTYKNEISLIFYNNHPTVLSRPMISNAIEIGGIHIQPAKPLPEDLQNFIDEAENGVILFTFGSVVKASTMTENMKHAFVEAFAHIPQRVIWKFEENISNISSNVMLSPWIPQRDILEHKNVIAFISHCGQSGMYEAIQTGTPVIAIPIFADQAANADILLELGVAVPLNFKSVTNQMPVLSALNTIINDTRYRERMHLLSQKFKDRPMTSQQSVVYWTEYVIRHNGTSHLQVIGKNTPLIQYLLVDIIVTVIILITILCYSVFLIFRRTTVIRDVLKHKINSKKKIT